MNCAKCGAEARVLRVEEGVEETVVHYVCPNRRCANYKREVGEKRLLRPRQRENAQGAGAAGGAAERGLSPMQETAKSESVGAAV